MAATQQQRATLYTTLAETMGDEAVDTLMAELPPGGWEQTATKQDLAGVETRLTAAMTVGFAELSVKLTEGLAHAATERAAINTRITEGLAHAATERAAINTRITEGLAHAATERAAINTAIIKGQARQLYVIVTTTVATIVAATVSIWIALFSALGS